jgi:hypothetical protein
MALKWVGDGSKGSIMVFDRVLHTQEAWGSSPYAPTLKINRVRLL